MDHDVVAPSNLNRQLLALHSTLGQKKTKVLHSRLMDINPELQVTVLDQFLNKEDAGVMMENIMPDYVLDCIDSIACKAALVKAAQNKQVPIISAMGAGNRLDVTQAKIGLLAQTSHCPLAREMRRRLRKMDADLSYPVIFSDEPHRPPLPHQLVGDAESGVTRAINGTISYLPGLFGLMMAGYAIHDLLLKSDRL